MTVIRVALITQFSTCAMKFLPIQEKTPYENTVLHDHRGLNLIQIEYPDNKSSCHISHFLSPDWLNTFSHLYLHR